MKKWSKYFQKPSFLELTRKNLIHEDLRPLIIKWSGITENMRVLDVGCGTGYFTRFIGESGLDIHLTGIDNDDVFVEKAKEITQNSGKYSFLQANALELPFDNDSFDAVVSHTFLTSITDPVKALSEMKRVCKSGGRISSVTPMTVMFEASSDGNYPIECDWKSELDDLYIKMWTGYETVNPVSNYINDLPTAEIPHFFSKNNLKNICAYPIGRMFSFSNGTLSEKDRLEYLDLYLISEEQKLNEYMCMEKFRTVFSESDAARYKELLKIKYDFLTEHIDDNSIWEWNGGANLLITAVNP